METLLQIKVEETVLNDAEITARRSGSTVADLTSKYVLYLAKQNYKPYTNEVNSYEELRKAIEVAEEDFAQGRIVSEKEMMDKIKKYAGIN